MKLTDKNKERRERSKDLQSIAPVLSSSWQLVITIILGAVVGYYLDEWNNTAPRYLIIMLIAFTVLAFYNFLRTVIRLSKAMDKKDKNKSTNKQQ